MTNCPFCKRELSGRTTHFWCSKEWLLELLRQRAPALHMRLSTRIGAVQTQSALESVAMAVGQNLATADGNIRDLFARWYTRCISPEMPTLAEFRDWREPTPSRSALPVRPSPDRHPSGPASARA